MAIYIRGYYRCSTSKGCSAKKQVERCRTDASMLIVTYTSTHNHPAPELSSSAQQSKESPTQTKEEDPPAATTLKVEDLDQEEEEKKDEGEIANDERNLQYLQSPIEEIIMEQEEDPFKLNPEKTQERIDLVLEEEPLMCYSQVTKFSTLKPEELEFFDELEELPMSSSLLKLMRSSFSDERIPIAPS